MDPLRITARAVFAYVVLLILIRVSGKHTIKQSSPFDFTLSLILGDMVDDVLWQEVAASTFVVAAGVLVVTHAVLDFLRFRASGAGVR